MYASAGLLWATVTGGLRSGRLRHVLRVCLPAACPVFPHGRVLYTVYSRCALVRLGQAGRYLRGDGTLFAAGAVHGSFAEDALICLMRQGRCCKMGVIAQMVEMACKEGGDQHVGKRGSHSPSSNSIFKHLSLWDTAQVLFAAFSYCTSRCRSLELLIGVGAVHCLAIGSSICNSAERSVQQSLYHRW